MSLNSGTLWIVATPLGNPGDLSPRAREVLGSAHGILAEDTRKTGALFSRCGVKAAAFTSFHDHNEQSRLPQVLAWLKEGRNLALVSDAGTPLLSDPGYRLVRACRNEGIPVSPIPGPSAPLAALSASGLPPHPFVFLGFAPRKASEREALFAPYAALPATLIFFERKDRLSATLQSAFKVLGTREACVARELTKPYEEFLFFPLEEYAALPDLLGEITVILGPPSALKRSPLQEVDRVLKDEAAQGGRRKDAVQRAQERLAGWSAKELYGRLCDIGTGEEP